MKRILNPSLEDLRLECVLMQAWKKTSSYLRTHSWYADTLGIDYQSLRIPAFLAEIQEGIDSYATWSPEPLELVPAPKTQRWCFDDRGNWIPRPNQNYQKRLRPLAHLALRDQVVATAIMLCLADRIETRMNDTRLSIDSEENRRRVLAYRSRFGERTIRRNLEDTSSWLGEPQTSDLNRRTQPCPASHNYLSLSASTSATTSRGHCSTSSQAWAAGSSTSRTPADTHRESFTDVVMPLVC